MSPAINFKFRLYLSGDSPNSAEAEANLGTLCRRYLAGRFKIEIVDVAKEPNRALTDGIYMTPSLLKLAPSPVRMIVGTLSNPAVWLRSLGLTETPVEA
jgi:circadian clock protein KaiB